MHYVIPLILLLAFLYMWLRKASEKIFDREIEGHKRLKLEYETATSQNSRLIKENSDLERSCSETIELYGITRDIYKTLDEDKILKLFQERINKYIQLAECKFLKFGADLNEYRDYTIMPLKIQKNTVGFLVASGIQDIDKEKFFILGNQFLIGIKRAFLYQKVQELTITDGLTQVFSRRYFLEKFNDELKRSQNTNRKFSFLMIDIDHFKSINDNYGHLVGDAVIKEITKIIKENIRQVDYIGRYGGEELSIILTETDKDQARLVAERIRFAVETKHLSAYDEALSTTISIGISMFPDDGQETGKIIDRADLALYSAKQSGRNKVCLYKS
jgi:diguanylate cyclase (GGDEF)-like protein